MKTIHTDNGINRFIDEKGNAIAQATGAIDEETLQQGIDMIISDR